MEKYLRVKVEIGEVPMYWSVFFNKNKKERHHPDFVNDKKGIAVWVRELETKKKGGDII